MKPTVVDPDRLTAAAREVETQATAMARHLEGLRSAVGGTGTQWGQDEPGQIFGQAYVEIRQHAMEAFDSHVKLLARASENLAGWAKTAAETEQHLTRGFDRVPLPGSG
jgi:hypothetical protein